jgi:hypothetical protein
VAFEALSGFVIEGVGAALKRMENSLESVGEADVEAECRDGAEPHGIPRRTVGLLDGRYRILWGIGLIFCQYIWLCYKHVHRIIN